MHIISSFPLANENIIQDAPGLMMPILANSDLAKVTPEAFFFDESLKPIQLTQVFFRV